MVSRKIRPRTCFETNIKPQISEYCSVLFEGDIETLLKLIYSNFNLL